MSLEVQLTTEMLKPYIAEDYGRMNIWQRSEQLSVLQQTIGSERPSTNGYEL
jgi:hypothetical protein